jgi:hypothetical protein
MSTDEASGCVHIQAGQAAGLIRFKPSILGHGDELVQCRISG